MRRSSAWGRFVGVGVGYLLAAVLVYRFDPSVFLAPWFVVVAMVCVLGLAAVSRPVVRLRLPAGVRAVRGWECRWLFGPLGVAAFGRLLRTTPLRLLNTFVYRRPGSDDRERLEAELEAAEVSHLVSAALVVPYMVRLAVHGDWASLLWVSAAQGAINVYPVMHLRLTRWRLGRLIDLLARQERRRARLVGGAWPSVPWLT